MKKQLLIIAAAAVLFIAGLALQQAGPVWLSPALCVLSYLTVGGEVLLRAARNICHGKVFDENFLMCVATIGAFGVQEYPEAAAVMLFYQVGELFQQYAVDKSRRSIAALMDIRPDSAWKLIDGKAEKVDPETVAVGDLIQVRPGEKVPLDGVVTEGDSMLNTAALTGESVPREVRPGDDILSGSINLNGVITVRVTKVFSESTVSKILDLVENASARKAKSEQFISRFAAVYTPIVVIAAVLLATVPVLLFHQPFTVWLTRALTFLVVSCPCALVISVPLSFFGGIGGAAKAGILVKGGNYLEALAHTEIAVFDKTGTLTQGVFAVQEVRPVGMTEEELLQLAAAAEQFSAHPIAQSLRDACPQASALTVQEVRETAGHGVCAEVSGRPVCVGSERMLNDAGITCLPVKEPGTVVHVAVSGAYAGYIRIADAVKPDAAKTIACLKAAHVRRTVMLTGDALSAGQAVGTALGMDAVYAELLPADKLDRLEQQLAALSPSGRLIFVGDGINDAPVLARADVGIAMGALGADAAIEAADVVIMTDEPSKVSAAIRIAQKTLRIVRQNIVFALGVKIAVLLLGAAGIVGMWAAVFADVGVSVLAILNALRMLRPNN